MRSFRWILVLLMALMIAMLTVGGTLAHDDDDDDDNDKKGKTYRVTITNLTKKQVFSKPLVVSHKKKIRLFEVGQPASDGIVAIAEGGNNMPLVAVLGTLDEVFDYAMGGMNLMPGQSMTLKVNKRGRFNRLSVVGMLVSTNDAFFAVNSTKFPGNGKTLTALAYDSGSEANTELCTDLPGPPCTEESGNQRVTDGAEGFIHVHNGIHGGGDLNEANMTWHNPVAMITIERMRDDD